MIMTTTDRFALIEKAVLDWIDLAYEKHKFTREELRGIESFWDDVVTLVNDNIETDYFEQD